MVVIVEVVEAEVGLSHYACLTLMVMVVEMVEAVVALPQLVCLMLMAVVVEVVEAEEDLALPHLVCSMSMLVIVELEVVVHSHSNFARSYKWWSWTRRWRRWNNNLNVVVLWLLFQCKGFRLLLLDNFKEARVVPRHNNPRARGGSRGR